MGTTRHISITKASQQEYEVYQGLLLQMDLLTSTLHVHLKTLLPGHGFPQRPFHSFTRWDHQGYHHNPMVIKLRQRKAGMQRHHPAENPWQAGEACSVSVTFLGFLGQWRYEKGVAGSWNKLFPTGQCWTIFSWLRITAWMQSTSLIWCSFRWKAVCTAQISCSVLLWGRWARKKKPNPKT